MTRPAATTASRATSPSSSATSTAAACTPPLRLPIGRSPGKPWETGREQALLEARSIAAAYAEVTGAPLAEGQGILEKYRSQYKVSIEDFAKQVDAYIQRQGPDFRLNFFVDEAGQYIANNVKLMTNLQTIAESLASKSRGRAWIVVTAQDEMDDVVGEMSRDTANDFSKIQARFANAHEADQRRRGRGRAPPPAAEERGRHRRRHGDLRGAAQQLQDAVRLWRRRVGLS